MAKMAWEVEGLLVGLIARRGHSNASVAWLGPIIRATREPCSEPLIPGFLGLDGMVWVIDAVVGSLLARFSGLGYREV